MTKILSKAGVFVIRPKPDGSGPAELLLFTHVDSPDAPIQIPGGSIDPGEDPFVAALRELKEEAGVGPIPRIRPLGVSEDASISNTDVVLRRHCYLLDGTGLPNHWVHIVTGAGQDNALRFEYRWHRVTADLKLTGDFNYFLNSTAIPELYAVRRPCVAKPFALLINGSINAGKTTVARALRVLFPSLAHVEVDALGEFLPTLPFRDEIALNLKNAALVTRSLLDAGHPVIVTYPLSNDEHARLASALAPYPTLAFTLAPPLEIALGNRGSRALTPWEVERIQHHYAVGVPCPAFGRVINNSRESPGATASRILAALGLVPLTPAIRPATPADAPDIARIHVEAWRTAYRGIIPAAYLESLSIEKRSQGWAKNLGENRDAVLVAEIGGTAVGWISFGPCRDEADAESKQAEIYAIYLDPAHRRTGLGRALMAEAERTLTTKATNVTHLSLWVLARNEPARRFYGRLGFSAGQCEKIELIGGESFTELRYEKLLPP